MAATELSKSMNEFLTKLQDDLKEAMNTMMCTKCEGKHKYGVTHPASPSHHTAIKL